MATATLKCCGCKKRFKREEMFKSDMPAFHSVDCMTSYAMAKSRKDQVKAKKKKNSEFKQKFYETDTKTRKKAAKTACHEYIRERDKGKPCKCCGREWKEDFQAGHWLESGNHPFIRYHEDNIWGQSLHCNLYKGGDSGDYERNLRGDIGDERVDYLLENRNKVVKYTCEDYKEIEAYFKLKLKEIRE